MWLVGLAVLAALVAIVATLAREGAIDRTTIPRVHTTIARVLSGPRAACGVAGAVVMLPVSLGTIAWFLSGDAPAWFTWLAPALAYLHAPLLWLVGSFGWGGGCGSDLTATALLFVVALPCEGFALGWLAAHWVMQLRDDDAHERAHLPS